MRALRPLVLLAVLALSAVGLAHPARAHADLCTVCEPDHPMALLGHRL